MQGPSQQELVLSHFCNSSLEIEESIYVFHLASGSVLLDLRLSCNDLKLQVLFCILKRFSDNLAGRYNFIVKKISLVFTCSGVPRAWNLEIGNHNLILASGRVGVRDCGWGTCEWECVGISTYKV